MSFEFMQSYNRADVALPSGIGVTLALVRVQDCITTGGIPIGILREMDAIAEAAKAKANGNGEATKDADAPDPDPSPEVVQHGMWLRREMVRRTIRRVAPTLEALDGPDLEDVPMWVVDRFDQADFDVLADYALRNTPLPAGSPA